jgi:O-methyltransferase involved in polyketide biosynthesis
MQPGTVTTAQPHLDALARIAEHARPVRDGHVFAAVDFEAESLRDGLTRTGLDWSRPTFFSWLGVTIYLTAKPSTRPSGA